MLKIVSRFARSVISDALEISGCKCKFYMYYAKFRPTVQPHGTANAPLTHMHRLRRYEFLGHKNPTYTTDALPS